MPGALIATVAGWLMRRSVVIAYTCSTTDSTWPSATSPYWQATWAAITLGAKNTQLFWKLRLPSSMPYFFTSLKIAMAASLVGAIVGELPTGAVAGLGARLLAGSYYGQTIQIWAAESTRSITATTSVGDIEVISIQTSTRTMVANGYLSHNCQGTALDILTETIIELDRRGLGDSMLWWMHDEILVSGPPEVAREVQEVMEIVPDFMRTWPGHIDKLRTECEVRIGAAWAEKGPVVHDWDDVPSDDPADYEEASA